MPISTRTTRRSAPRLGGFLFRMILSPNADKRLDGSNEGSDGTTSESFETAGDGRTDSRDAILLSRHLVACLALRTVRPRRALRAGDSIRLSKTACSTLSLPHDEQH